MKIIDFEIKGSQVKFYLGKDNMEHYYGDDWNDRPYEHNAGTVYSEFVEGYVIKNFDFDDIVMEPCDGHTNSSWSKDDMRDRKVPCVSVLPVKYQEEWGNYYKFEDISGNNNSINFYLGDIINEMEEDIVYVKDNNSVRYLKITCDGDDKALKTSVKMLSDLLSMRVVINRYTYNEDEYLKYSNLKVSEYKTLLKSLLKECLKFYGYTDNISNLIKTLSIEIVPYNYNLKSNNTENEYYICISTSNPCKFATIL